MDYLIYYLPLWFICSTWARNLLLRGLVQPNTQALVRGVAPSHTTFDPSDAMISPLENPAIPDHLISVALD